MDEYEKEQQQLEQPQPPQPNPVPIPNPIPTEINSGAVIIPQPSPEDEAKRRLNERLDLYELEHSRDIPEDGNCQMHALSDQLYGNLNHSSEIRRVIATWLIRNKNFTLPNGAKLSQFANTTNWNRYCNRMARRGTWGDHLTLLAAAEILKSQITVISSVESDSSAYIEIIPSSIENNRAIVLSHLAENHYGSLRQRPIANSRKGLNGGSSNGSNGGSSVVQMVVHIVIQMEQVISQFVVQVVDHIVIQMLIKLIGQMMGQ
ncbi:hypothetical protein DICPUDRAFT_156452 [Dictyostelium purpureum]|uniref:OTU domain-containing protein n=1 Tax=Dictyostelium purpureum TaxID=5786 RepID=F0ZWL7_DICPU|nr:uncharacterized protein DICPUDRAFT_156452 [Dictyostelium purpureum]EGC31680.1 hypothetical protein DICPUDRAFT_156452 [Dictyostelium purpureum]|eukprot:XP_003291811.1 hypothetical protein DICPUDRAFT_156452 [Dictyostelium purpureum]